ncbi:MAG: hypothetical protein ACTSPI_15305, partial [Candidatus Heimdallarchaeaceae archaeon]
MSEIPIILLGFERGIDAILEGERITRKEWNDKRTYGLLKDGILQLHKKGEAKELLHPWILSEA